MLQEILNKMIIRLIANVFASQMEAFTLHLNILETPSPTRSVYLLTPSSILQNVRWHLCCCTAGCTVIMFGNFNVICFVFNTPVEIHCIGAVDIEHFKGIHCN